MLMPNSIHVTMHRNRILILLSLVALVASCGTSPDARLEANKALVQRFGDTVNAADWDGLDALLTEDFQRHSQATAEMPEITSRDEFKALQRGFFASMPDQKVTLEYLVAEGDLVATYGMYSGTNTGPNNDIPATGRYAEMPFFTLFLIEDGRIAEVWVEWDNLGFLSQLGLFPPPMSEDEEETM